MNYIDKLALEIYRHSEPDGTPDEADAVLYRIYAVLALSKGEETTAKDVHDAWSAWMAGQFPEHRSLIPFDELSEDVQRYDDEYVEAIHAVSRTHGREEVTV